MSRARARLNARVNSAPEPESKWPDELVPDPVVWREFHISSMTGWRWTNDPELGFPRPIKIRNRCFRSRHALEEFKSRMLRESIAQPAKTEGTR